jgi:SAM-dependent methyltransferase
MGTATVQGQIWGLRARDWADVQEWTFAPVFEMVLKAAGVGPGSQILDIGCASCLYCEMAAKLGAVVNGLDAAEPLLDIARERVPEGSFHAGEMEALPFPDQSFDVVTGFNSFQFAANPTNALREAQRVLRRGGSLVIAVLGKPQEMESAGYFAALGSLVPPPPPGAPGPFALSFDGALEALVSEAGMKPGPVEVVDIPWEYPDEATLLRGLLSSGPAIRASQHSGEDAVREAVLKAVAPYRTPLGGCCMRNKARYMIVKV